MGRSGRAHRSEPNYAERLAADFADSSDYRGEWQRPDNCSHQFGVGQSTGLRRLATDRRHAENYIECNVIQVSPMFRRLSTAIKSVDAIIAAITASEVARKEIGVGLPFRGCFVLNLVVFLYRFRVLQQ